MALPTTNLTVHWDASAGNGIYKTFVGGSPPGSGAPADGDNVEVIDDRADGSLTDFCFTFSSLGAEGPTYKSGASALMKSGLAELQWNGSSEYLTAFNNAGTVQTAASAVISSTAWTIAGVCMPATISDTQTDPWQNHALLSMGGGNVGISFKDVSGTPTLRAWCFDGATKEINATVGTNRNWIYVYRYDGSNLKLTVINDAGTENNPSNVASGNPTALTGLVRMGVYLTTGGAAYFAGRDPERAFYNAELTGSNLTDLKSYFVDKWLTGAVLGGTVKLLAKTLRPRPFAPGLAR